MHYCCVQFLVVASQWLAWRQDPVHNPPPVILDKAARRKSHGGGHHSHSNSGTPYRTPSSTPYTPQVYKTTAPHQAPQLVLTCHQPTRACANPTHTHRVGHSQEHLVCVCSALALLGMPPYIHQHQRRRSSSRQHQHQHRRHHHLHLRHLLAMHHRHNKLMLCGTCDTCPRHPSATLAPRHCAQSMWRQCTMAWPGADPPYAAGRGSLTRPPVLLMPLLLLLSLLLLLHLPLWVAVPSQTQLQPQRHNHSHSHSGQCGDGADT